MSKPFVASREFFLGAATVFVIVTVAIIVAALA